MFGTFIGPGTIFLMMVSAIQAVFAVDIYSSFIWNFIPLSIFMTICYFCKQKYQLTAAFIISVLYSLIMMAVMVGVAIQVMTEGIFAPSSSFFFIVAFQVIITGILHPQEIQALPAGIIYYITIPCMYMLLIIYSLFNLNDVSWGTRENPQDASSSSSKVENKKQTKLQKVLGYLKPNGEDEDDGSFEFSFAGLFRCILCTHKKTDTIGIQLNSIENSLSYLTDKISNLEKKMNHELNPIMDNNNENDEIESDDELEEIPLIDNEIDMKKNLLPDWLYDPDLIDGETDTIPASEEQFWVDLIEKYLTPLDMTSKDKEQMQNQLKTLRDISVFAFTMGNALFVLINLLLQLNKEYLQMKWPFNVKNVIIYDGNTMEIKIERDYLHLEPISLLFVTFFGVVLFVQFIAMLFHRFATISQILATTTIDWYCGRKVKDTVTSSELREKAVEIARYLQRPRPEWKDDDDDDESNVTEKIRKDTLHRLLMQHQKKKDWSNLETNFKREFFKDTELKLKKLKLCRRTMSILDEMRKSTAEFRRIKKSSNYNVNNYHLQSEGAYSNVDSYNSTVDSFSLYQKTSYQASSSTQSVHFNVNKNPQLRSALKRPKSQPTFNLNDDFSIYGESGHENYGFENESKPDIYNIEENVKKENEKDTYI